MRLVFFTSNDTDFISAQRIAFENKCYWAGDEPIRYRNLLHGNSLVIYPDQNEIYRGIKILSDEDTITPSSLIELESILSGNKSFKILL